MIKKVKKVTSKKSGTTKAKVSSRVDSIVTSINKRFGDNAIILGVGSKSAEVYKKDFISTGILQLDADLNGGIAVGRYTEISGAFSTTKTTLGLHVLANAQKRGMTCALIDVEGTSGDEDYLRACGVDPTKIYYCTPSSLEELVDVLIELQSEGKVKFALYDSIAASMATNLELNTKIGDSMRMGVPQQELGSYFRRFQMLNNKFFRNGETPFTLVAINQLREKIGAYGDSEYTPGGRGKGFVSSCELRLRQGDWIKEKNVTVGQVVKYKISKNKMGKRMRQGEVDFYFDENEVGVSPLNYDVMKDLIIVALQYGIIQKAGGWFSYKDLQKIQGAESFIDALKERNDLMKSIRKEVMEVVEKTHKGKE